MCWYKVPLVTVLVLVVVHADPCDSDETCHPNMVNMEDTDSSSLMQVKYEQPSLMQNQDAQSQGVAHVFTNLPFNFGNTIIAAATGQKWGQSGPGLNAISNITNCPLFLTPPKYWPQDVAAKYFGNKIVFGVIRDPFERLVAEFRGKNPNYGGSGGKACDVNNAVKDHLKKLKASGDMFQGGCTNIPQAEWFEGPYGIKVPLDNWRFPTSVNEFFANNGYPWYISQQDIWHVTQCNDHWMLEFDQETRDLVMELYSKDFDIICKSFGHCDLSEVNCLQGVHQMCPETTFDWDFEKGHYCPRPWTKQDALASVLRQWPECNDSAY